MANKGHSSHTKRISLGRNLRVSGRKSVVWLTTSKPGPHPKDSSMPLSMLLREEIPVCKDLAEAKKVLNSGAVLIDGKAVKDCKRPIGLMDIISLPSSSKHYRMQIIGGQLRAKEISGQGAKIKYCKVVGKRSCKGSKISITLHDGRTMFADNKVKVGSTLKMSVPDFKLQGQIEMAEGAQCFVIKGKHAGKLAHLKKITQKEGAMPTRGHLEENGEEFVTLTNYLIAVDDGFEK
ncbi:MAG: hypothetical protein V1822_02605 [Candidatus Micrarchaeota archaeon]